MKFPLQQTPRAILQSIFAEALQAVKPDSCVAQYLPTAAEVAAIKGRVVVVGAGKASAAMAHALEEHWPGDKNRLSGLVITRYGHARPYRFIEIVEAAHPIPDEAGERAARRMLQETVKDLTADDFVIALISGGGSALLALPAPGISFEEKQQITRQLVASGASIGEMNCVRKHLSAIKGGRLAQAIFPAPLLTLLISDVPGDEPAIIASGPTVPDLSTSAQALAILQRYAVSVSPAVRQHLLSPASETPKPDLPCFAVQDIRMIATPQMALERAATAAKKMGIAAHILSDAVSGEAQEIAKFHAALARQVATRGQPFPAPCLILAGGETSVTLKMNEEVRGQGGRNVEMLLSMACELRGSERIYALAADTDGIDGSVEVAGAIIGPDTFLRAQELGLSPHQALARHDGHGFFAALGDGLVTGATYTNVGDFHAVLVLAAEES